tara:strand:- start:3056 stop:4546 length:1491 start_codon:yes stop_codon:yes gene_type:complete
MMKNYKKIIGLFLAFSIAVSCNDAIEIDQPGRLGAEQAFNSVADLQLGLLGAYSNYDQTPEIQFNAIFTDELSIGSDNGGQGLGGDYAFVLNPGSTFPRVLWTNYYAALNSINRVLVAAEGIVPEAGDQAQYNDIKGQALALRAYAHFQLLSYLSPDLTDDSSLGTIILDFVPTIDQTLPRNTTGEVFGSILSDLDSAEPLLADAANATFVSTSFVRALKARIALYRKQYTQADALAAGLVSDFPLANRSQYVNLFDDSGNSEVIFKLERTVGDGYDRQGSTGSAAAGGWAGANFAFVNGTIDGSPYFEIGRSLFNLLDPNDVRYDVNVHPTSLINPNYATSPDAKGTDILVVGKYTGSEGQPLMNDLKIFRSAEMVLIRAEAAVAANNLAGAAGYIKQLRDARFNAAQPLPTYASQQIAYADILNERRIEFAFEGHRYLDLKRIGVAANQGVLRDPVDCAINGACDLAASDFRFAAPIPLVELNANPVIQQNPQY